MTTFVSPHHDESLRTPARRFDYISTPAIMVDDLVAGRS
jgi:hypothetical protein